jgi:AraC-like DNA-binding protein
MTVEIGLDEKIYPVSKLATIVASLAADGVSAKDALYGVHILESALAVPATRVSLNQTIECCRNAIRLAHDPHFPYRTGRRFHVSTYGIYGFAILSSTDFRQTMRFIENYHQLATPLCQTFFKEERDSGVWTIAPIPHLRIDAPLYKFLVELQFGIYVSLQRDVMGHSFVPREFHVTYRPPDDARSYREAFGCEVLFGQPENELIFDAAWLDHTPELGNELTYLEVVKLCDHLIEEMQLHVGLAGKVRKILLARLMRPMSLDEIAERLHMTTRTLRRRLRAENTSFRELADELKMHVAIKYLRDTDLTIDEISGSLGFNDAAGFRHAFRRWTDRAPLEFRRRARDEVRQPTSPG